MPRQNLYRTDPILTNISLEYRNATLLKPLLFPDVVVPQASGKWFVYDKANNTSASDADELAIDSRASSLEDEYNLTLAPFGPIPKRSRKIFITDDEVKLAPNPLSPRVDATEVVTDRYDLRGEIQAATIMQTSSNFGATLTKSGTGQWNDYTNSDPIADIESMVEQIMLGAVTDPDTCIMPFKVWRVLRRHPKLVALFTYTSGGLLTRDQFLELLNEYGITRFEVARTVRNTAAAGQTAVLDWVWGKHFWIIKAGDANLRTKDVTFGRNLVVDGFKRQVQTHVDWDPDGEWVRVQGQEKPWVMAKEAGAAIYNAIA